MKHIRWAVVGLVICLLASIRTAAAMQSPTTGQEVPDGRFLPVLVSISLSPGPGPGLYGR